MPLNIDKIRKIRGKKSQAEVAVAAGMTREAFAKILAGGNPTLLTLEKIAGALGCKVKDLLTPPSV
jgi:transcriptional regulator with XRE-family HTH domain